jgi:RNA polymerase sigma-70 factor (ECF subfamily)
MSDPDVALVQMAKDGHQDGLESLYRKYLDPIYRFCYWQTNRSQDAEDLTQDIFIEMTKSLHTFKGDASFKNWLYVIAKHKISSWIKQKYQLPILPLFDQLPTPEEWIDPQNQDLKTKTITSLLKNLDPTERKVLTSRYLKGVSVAETATQLKLSVSNVKVITHRALKKLQQLVTSSTLYS